MTAQDKDAAGAPWPSDGPVDCEAAIAQLFSFLDSELDEASSDLVRAHIADCESCLAEYDVEHHLKALVRRSCCEEAPVELRVRIRAQLASVRIDRLP